MAASRQRKPYSLTVPHEVLRELLREANTHAAESAAILSDEEIETLDADDMIALLRHQLRVSRNIAEAYTVASLLDEGQLEAAAHEAQRILFQREHQTRKDK